MNMNAEMARKVWKLFENGNSFRSALAKIPHTAIRNILSASKEAQVPEEIYILLQYQEGRKILSADARTELEKQLKGLCTQSAQFQKLDVLNSQQEHVIQEELKKVCAFLGHVVRMHRAITA